MEIGSVRIFVFDLPSAEAFYARKLGLQLLAGSSEAGYCVFSAGPVQLVVESVPPDAPEDDSALVGRFSGVSFSVADARATYSQLEQRGVRFTEPPERQPWGGILATFVDSSGNRLQLVQSPGAA